MEDIKQYYLEKQKTLRIEIANDIYAKIQEGFGNAVLEDISINQTGETILFWVNNLPWELNVYQSPFHVIVDSNYEKFSGDFRGEYGKMSDIFLYLEYSSDEITEELTPEDKKELQIRLKKIGLSKEEPNLRDMGMFEIKRYKDI